MKHLWRSILNASVAASCFWAAIVVHNNNHKAVLVIAAVANLFAMMVGIVEFRDYCTTKKP